VCACVCVCVHGFVGEFVGGCPPGVCVCVFCEGAWLQDRGFYFLRHRCSVCNSTGRFTGLHAGNELFQITHVHCGNAMYTLLWCRVYTVEFPYVHYDDTVVEFPYVHYDNTVVEFPCVH